MAEGSKAVVYAALAGNFAIAVGKFIVAGMSGSSSMLAEAFHSTIDTANESLLLWGMYRSQRPPDRGHPFGHGRELYFWAMIVAVVIFGIGGGASLLEGWNHVQHPEDLHSPKWNYVVLALSFVFEGTSWIIGMREFLRRKRPERTFWQSFLGSKDPSVFTVVFEDTAALVGLLIAFFGVWASAHFQRPMFDGIASMLIGLLLCAVAVLLGREVKGLLIGESADPEIVKRIAEIVNDDPDIIEAGDPLTMQLAPRQVLLNMDLKFRDGLDRNGIERAIDRIETAIRAKAPEVTHIFLEAEALKQDDGRQYLYPRKSA
jgi:cation diffusion facilitator family transporter